MKQRHTFGKSRIGRGGQRGGLTIFSAALILILLTIALLYATQVSLFESRISGNEVRQKGAFHVAEAVLEQSVMYVLANTNVILSSRENVFPDGTGGSFTRDGWLPPSSGAKWAFCPTNPAATHPCGGEVEAKTGSFYYDTDGDTTTFESLPVNQTDFPVGATARVGALMCFVDLNDTTADCRAPASPTTPDQEANSALMITLLAYGYSDCTDVTDVSTCTGRATIAKPVGTDRKLSGSPSVPLVAKSSIPLSGTFEVVGNPNGGGVGVPLTTWMDSNSDLLTSGTWQTCEMEEWYHVGELPADVACTDNNCLCGSGGNDTSEFLSYRAGGGDTHIGIDIIQDPAFPPDLFEFYFTVPRALYGQVKSDATKIDAADCGNLDSGSSGLIWVNGGNCDINGNSTIGSPQAPVILVSAADRTTINAGAVIFGIVYIFDDDPAGHGAELRTSGNATIYGACIVDGEIDQLQGTFQVVYNNAVIASAAGFKGVGAMNGGWRDFGLPDIAW